ncbi:MAG: hypothetical protein QW707_07390 [Candidatus Bathyarchaeia archaeon]
MGALEDAYTTSRYVARAYMLEEVARLKKVVEDLIHAIREVIG